MQPNEKTVIGKRKIVFITVTALISISLTIFICEILVRFFRPQVTIIPRWQYSRTYGSELPKNSQMIHSLPYKWRFIYTINSLGYRGPVIPLSNKYAKKNILVLGDSYAFGTGVNDGQEFPAIMQSLLKDKFNIINLAVGGYGLTQEMRRFYEFGFLYQPVLVVLQFCKNDPGDNFINRVTEIKNHRILFKNIDQALKWYTRFLSLPLMQRSQLYNFVRHSLYPAIAGQFSKKENQKVNTQLINKEENYYNLLIDNFANDLKSKHIFLIFISVGNDLDNFPQIKNKIYELDKSKNLKFLQVATWLEGRRDYLSPEGHWGAKAHRIIGEKIGSYILQNSVN